MDVRAYDGFFASLYPESAFFVGNGSFTGTHDQAGLAVFPDVQPVPARNVEIDLASARYRHPHGGEVIRGKIEPDLAGPQPEHGIGLVELADVHFGPLGQKDELPAVEL
jgi:hypothetical protein